jgi:hypothetical protein
MAKVVLIKVLLISIFLVYADNSIAQDITYLAGSGNFTNGATTDEEIHQIKALNFYGAKRVAYIPLTITIQILKPEILHLLTVSCFYCTKAVLHR